MCVCVRAYAWTCVYIYMCVYRYMYIYIYIYIYICVCMYMCVCVYISISLRQPPPPCLNCHQSEEASSAQRFALDVCNV